MPNSRKITPVLLSGGVGSRLWPLSRETRPKQFQAFIGERTLIQQSALRMSGPDRFGPMIVVANREHRFLVAEQLREAGIDDARIVLEPVGRNTAPAAAVAAALALRDDPEALILVAPADHLIGDPAAYLQAVDQALDAKPETRLTLFGIVPTAPATGYGYIRLGAPIGQADSLRHVAEFVEKPRMEIAAGFLASGEYLWNSGIFLLPAKLYLAELGKFEPTILSACEAAIEEATVDSDFLSLESQAFQACRSISIDHAVMERTQAAAVVRADFGWTDIGSWSALWDVGHKDPEQNVTIGHVLIERGRGNYIRSHGPLVAALGVDNLIVIVTEDAVLVASKEADQDVKKIVDRVTAEGLLVAAQTARAIPFRPCVKGPPNPPDADA